MELTCKEETGKEKKHDYCLQTEELLLFKKKKKKKVLIMEFLV